MAGLEEIVETGLEIAVIGMAGRFSGAKNTREFWENLKQGVEPIPFFNDEEIRQQTGRSPGEKDHANLIKSNGGFLEDIEYFDAAFFGYTPMEAQHMAPQIRIFHECLWEALEDAGCDPEQENILIGLYAGASSTYNWEFLCSRAQAGTEIDEFVLQYLGNRDFISTLISYKLNLKGPGFFMHTACSTSLAAIHLACQGLLCSDCDMALAGGIALALRDSRGCFYREGMILSPDGHCRTFDKKAGGTIGGEGAGIVVLRRLEDALTSRDHIYAIIKGSAVNNDGNRKVGFTAPSIEAQAEVIRKALRMAELKPETISYIETHGTGTPLGDSAEIEALKLAFDTREKQFCALGSVKTNIGHLDAAAGVASIIKTILSLKYKQLIPTLHFETPNPGMNLENSPFYIIKELKPWHNNGQPLRAGVSSFGIGGTNAHLILEEFPLSNEEIPGRGGGPPDPPLKSREYQLLVLSAKTPSALDKMTENLAEYFRRNFLNRGNHENLTNPVPTLTDVAYTLQLGRKQWPYRRKLVCSSVPEAAAALTAIEPRQLQTHLVKTSMGKKSIIFLFPGLGSQYVNMGREIYQTEPGMRKEMDRCFDILKDLLPYYIKEILYPLEGSHGSQQPYNINDFEVAQLVTFIIQYSLARVLMSWGIQPWAMMGYSFGEYTAACLAGVFTLEDALKLLVTRGNLTGELPPGMMLNVPLPTKKVRPLLTHGLGIGIDNGASCVVSGGTAPVKAFEKNMKQQKVMCMPLESGRGIHSPLMDPILAQFVNAVATIPLQAPKIPYISSVTGSWIVTRDAVSPTYWGRQLRETVRFSAGIQKLLNEPAPIFLEVGAGRELSAMVSREQQEKGENQKAQVVHLVPPKNVKKEISHAYYLLDKIGLLWLYGVTVNWREYYTARAGNRVSLPTYPFERQRFWKLVEDYQAGNGPGRAGQQEQQDRDASTVGELADWFYVPTWIQKELIQTKQGNKTRGVQLTWMIFMDTCGIGDGIRQQLEASNHHQIIQVKKGPGFEKDMKGEYTINPRDHDHYRLLLEEIGSAGSLPQRILHLWGITADNQGQGEGGSDPRGVIEGALQNGFYSLLYLAKALGRARLSDGNIDIRVITNHMQDVTGEEDLEPGKVAVLGPCRVIPQEYPHLTCKNIDIDSWETPGLKEQLLAEITAETSDHMSALRGSHRWVQTYQLLPRQGQEIENPGTPPLLRWQGIYLITGGLGNIGYLLAQYLIKRVNARVILTGRTPLPPPEIWGQAMILADKEDKIYQYIKKMQRLRDMGGEVLYTCADVSDPGEMREALRQGQERYGPINGIIHAAGIVSGESFNPIAEITSDQCKLQFSTKVQGMVVLEELLKARKPDFCLVISSICTVLGGLGFVAYAAANHFMEAFSNRQQQKRQEPWIIVDWDGTNPEDTVRAFNYILAQDAHPRLIFSRGGDLQGRISRWVTLEGLRPQVKEAPGENDRRQPAVALYMRPELSNPYVAPRNPLEQRLADIWQRFFGIEKIGVTDDLYDLGGDSLKAINMIAIIHKELDVLIPIKEFFDQSTIEGAARYISGAEKQEFVSIVPGEKKEYYELSSAQKRLYFLQEAGKTDIVYNSPQVFSLEGPRDKNRLEQVVREMIQRHESFRTSIRLIDAEPVQVVHRAGDIDFAIDYHDMAKGEKEQVGSALPGNRPEVALIDSFIRPFDMAKAPFLRVGLIKIRELRYILIFDLHHIVTDGVSHEIISAEFTALYAGGTLAPLRLQYKDYAEWQNHPRQQELRAKQENYWVKQFQSNTEIPVLVLPYDYPRPPVHSFAGRMINFALEEAETRALRKLAADQNVTLYMLLLTLFNIFLHKLSGQEDIVVGTPVANRRHKELETIVGVFINTLPIRNYPVPGKTLQLFLQETRKNTLQAFENQDYQYEDLVEKIAIKRDISRNPLYDVLFVLQIRSEPTGIQGKESTGPWLNPYSYNTGISKLDMTLNAVEKGDGLFLDIEYCTALFKPGTIRGFISYFKRIVSAVIGDIGQSIADIDILSAQEKHRLLVEFNQTRTSHPLDKTIHQLFAEQAGRTPDSKAVMGAGPSMLTYRELGNTSGQLARALNAKGIIPDAIVGIMVNRSLEMITGLLGILKAGGAYLPLDPDYPRERVEFMLKDSSARVLVVDDALRAADLAFAPGELLNLSSRPHFNFPASQPVNLPAALPDNLANVIYTSGSTGKPKGVLVTHRNLYNTTLGYLERLPDLIFMDFILLSNYVFDATFKQLFFSIMGGACGHFPPGEIINDPESLFDYCQKNKVQVLNAPISFIKMITGNLPAHKKLPGVKYLLTGAEKLYSESLSEFFRFFPNARVINSYGPTEITITASIYQCSRDDLGKDIPIGTPINNTYIYILDRKLGLVPLAVPGEIFIGGKGITRGYLNNPELTAEKFGHDFWDSQDYRDEAVPFGQIENTFGNENQKVPDKGNPANYRSSRSHRSYIYRTGDLARWHADGNIEFIGRIDYQVKMRGFRIELGEIEERILTQENVKDVIVIAGEGAAGDKYLCAYIVANREITDKKHGQIETTKLREYLSTCLPDYMVPSYFIEIDHVPLTPSGKVDRGALPKPVISVVRTYAPPSSEIEKTLVTMWSGLLGRDGDSAAEPIGIHDNFFELGGHSLKAVTLLSRIHKVFEVKVPMDIFFKGPLIKDLSRYISAAVRERYAAVEPREVKEYYPLSSAQERLYLLQQMQLENTAYNMPRVIPLANEADRKQLQRALLKLIRRHESFRTSFIMVEEEPVQRVHPFDAIRLSIKTREVSPTMQEETAANFVKPFDLSRAPLLRAALVKVGATHSLLLIDMHHIICDGVSMEIVEKEFSRLYPTGELSHFSSLRIQYKDFSAWQNNKKRSGILKDQEVYWKKVFLQELPVLNLPIDYPRPAMQSFAGSTVGFTLDEKQTGTLKVLEKETGTTLYMVILSIYTLLLAKMSGQEDIVVGTPLAARRHADLEPVIGMIANTLAIRNFPAGDVTFTHFLTEVKKHTLAALENQEYQFEDLVEVLSPPRDTARNPVFDVMFNLLNREEETNEPAPNNGKPYEHRKGTAKFDLNLSVNVGKRVDCYLEYCTQLFKPRTIERMIGYFKNILNFLSIGANRNKKLSEIEIITGREKEEILNLSRGIEEEIPTGLTIHQWYGDKAGKVPDHIAVVGMTGIPAAVSPGQKQQDPFISSLSYRELDRRAGGLAAVLRQKGIKRNSIVGLMAERSLEMIIAVLAIMKAGGGYLPIDMEYPEMRKQHMIRDSEVKLLVTGEPIQKAWPTIEIVDIRESSRYSGAGAAPVSVNNSRDIVYVIYTSGSTGVPKGVVLEHRGLVNLLMFQYRQTGIDFTRVLQFTTISFDVSFQEIFSTLLAGGKLSLISGKILADIPGLFKVIEREKLKTLFLPASFLKFIINEENYLRMFPPGVDHIVTAGEQVIINDEFKEYLRKNNVYLHNHYGPTETHVVTALTLNPQENLPGLPPIGRPVTNTAIYILDPGMKLQPVGVSGELYIAGIQVGKGYLNNPELTAEKFCLRRPGGLFSAQGDRCRLQAQVELSKASSAIKPSPLGPPCHGAPRTPRKSFSLEGLPGDHLHPDNPAAMHPCSHAVMHPGNHSSRQSFPIYRTGDLARWRPDRDLEFLGRMDQQVKIRGYRVELGEIDSQLLNYPGIKESFTTAQTPDRGDVYLCAYIAAEKEIDSSQLREYLEKSLPVHMIPSYFVFLEKIPVTPNGKVDRKLLPQPELKAGKECIPPANRVEEKLATIWAEVLGIEKKLLSVEGNFFEWGGHSLKAFVIIAKIHKEFNVKIPLTEIFKTPTIRGLARYIQRSKKEQYTVIAPVEKKDSYPLSPAQKRMYILQRLEPGGTAYNMPEIIPLTPEGPLEKLGLVFTRLIQHHESLRTSFHMRGGKPVQQVHDRVEFMIEKGAVGIKVEEEVGPCGQVVKAIGGQYPRSREPRAKSFISSFIRAFDLSRAPLLRVRLEKENNGREFLLVDMHHIISDGISHQVLRKSFMSLYNGEELPPLPIQYKDFASWQTSEKQGQAIRDQAAYWHREFSADLPVLDFPLDFPRTPIRDFEGRNVEFSLSPATLTALKGDASINDTTLFMNLLALFNVFLSRLSGQEDIIVGTPSAGRRHAGLGNIMGMFVNTLAIRNFPSGEKPYREFLHQVKEQTLAAFENQDYPFEDLVERVKVRRDTARHPLFDVMFALDNYDSGEQGTSAPPPGLSSPLSSLAPGDLEIPFTAKFDLMLTAREHRGQLLFSIQYRPGLYKEETINRFITYFKNIVMAVMENPAVKLQEIGIIPEAEKRQVLYGFNGTTSAYAVDQKVHDLYGERAAASPDRIAVIGGTTGARCPALTYKELNRRTHELGHLLRKRGVGPDTITAIMADRSQEMIIGILGILKAGGAYMPIDPDYPGERIQYMLTDSRVGIILTTPNHQVKFEAGAEENARHQRQLPLQLIHIEPEPAPAFKPSPSTLTSTSTCQVSPANLAYIIYTSGTTGRPKGVMLQHSSLTAYIHSFEREFAISPGDIVLQQASYCFDAFVEEVYPVLLAGGKLAIPRKDDIDDIFLLVQFITRHQVTIIDCSPLLLNELNRLAPGTLSQVRIHTFISGGDELRTQYIDNLLKIGKVYNTYGPTETTVCATYYRCPGDMAPGPAGVPLGTPIANYRIYILDQWRALLPVGVPGELCISGPGVARGYLNQPELTADRFDHDLWDYWDYHDEHDEAAPFGQIKNTIGKENQKVPDNGNPANYRSSRSHRSYIYRTGDRARWQPDGAIQFLGRIDRQVKIRGYRIEPGEIEHQLLTHPCIKEVVVTDREDKQGDKYLCAYWVPDAGGEGLGELNVTRIRQFLSGKFAPYMIPSYFVQLEKIPITSSGKLEYNQLPETEVSQLKLATTYEGPGDYLEKLIAETWKEVLNADRVGTHDNFFEIGGNSLKIIRVSSLLTERLKVKIPVIDLFNYPTVHSLKEYLQLRSGLEKVEEGEQRVRLKPEAPVRARNAETAIIGMAGRFPGAGDILRYWENLEKGIESLSFFSPGELQEAGVSRELLENPGYVRVMGVLEDKDRFDAAFFNYTPQEARVMDPQMRIFHQCVWKALEDAGYNPETYHEPIGLYAGASKNPGWEARVRFFSGDTVMTGIEMDQLLDIHYIPARISYKLDLKGPGVFVQTACSTSLTAIHDACNVLAGGDCSMALAGGVSLYPEKKQGYLYEEGMIFSLDGHCRAFDAEAAGTTWGEGAAVVLLKPLERAIHDKDHIYALIKATAAANDGKRRVGFSAPSVDGQAQTIAAVYRKANIPSESITYIEAHGTGTLLGDPIEIQALKQAFKTRRKGFCAIGSVKSNIGHLDCAAGAAGFIKAVLALKHRRIPPTLHFNVPNPQTDLIDSPFYINTISRQWERGSYPLRAGVSSFGIGGTNVHVIIEETPVEIGNSEGIGGAPPVQSREYQLIVLSARTKTALDKMTRNLAEYLKKNLLNPGNPGNSTNPGPGLADVAYTLQLGRKVFGHRWMAVCATGEEAIAALDSPGGGEMDTVQPGEENQPGEKPGPASDRQSLTAVGRLWLRGKPIQWEQLYQGKQPGRVPLPAYPFEGNRNWIDQDPFLLYTNQENREAQTIRRANIADWFYYPRWVGTPPLLRQEGNKTPVCYLVCCDDSPLVLSLVRRLGSEGTGGNHTVISVGRGKNYIQVNQREFLIDPYQPEDYRRLLGELKRMKVFPARIVHTWNVTGDHHDDDAGKGAAGSGFYSLLYLAAAIAGQDFSGEIVLDVLTANIHEVSGYEKLDPAKAVVLGPLKVIPQEYPFIVCRNIDIEPPPAGSVQEENLVECLVNELCQHNSTTDTDIAYRGARRWTRTYEPFTLSTPRPGTLKLRDRGVYLVTGGCGQIGFILSEYLAKQVRARLVLTGRTPLPLTGQWDHWLETHEPDHPVSQKILKIRQLEASGGEVLVITADVADKQSMAEVVSRAEQTFAPINGIIHAAGVTTGKSIMCPIEETGEEECQQQFQPKIHGTLVLADLIRDKPLDFCILTSSLSPLLGGLGFAAYSAANAFMDAFVYQVNRGGMTHWLSVNWADWGGNSNREQQEQSGIGAAAQEFFITPAQGVETFERLLTLVRTPCSQVVVSSGDLQTRIDCWVRLRSVRIRDDGPGEAKDKDGPTLQLFPRPQLAAPYTAPRTPLEETIAAIWKQQLGFEQIGIQDDFFQLGGDSLKAVTMISRVHKDLSARVRLSEFFAAPFIENLAKEITAAAATEFEAIRPVEKMEYYALSPAQQRLYVLEQMENIGTGYNLPTFILLPGAIDRNRLHRVFTALIKRHESFRTSFEMVKSEPVQKIHDQVEFEIEYHNFTTAYSNDTGGKEEKNYKLQITNQEESCGLELNASGGGEGGEPVTALISSLIRPFDLSRAPLIRAGLCKIEPQQHILMVDMPHIISDGISHQILEEEFSLLNENKTLAPFPFQYKDYAGWWHTGLQQERVQAQEAYWLKEISEDMPLLDLPVDYPRSLVRSFAGGAAGGELNGEETRRLNEIARTNGGTLFMVLLAVYNIFLSKICGQEDILVGTPTAGRPHPDLEHIIGMFVNTLVMRNYPRPGLTFHRFLGQVKERTLQAFENQDYPFERLVEKRAKQRDTSRNPLFDAMFTLHTQAAPQVTGLTGPVNTEEKTGDLIITHLATEKTTAPFDLFFEAVEQGGKLRFSFNYCSQLFRKETIARFIGFLNRVIASVNENPDIKIQAIEIISPGEKKQVLFDFNETTADYPGDKTLHGLFAQQVEQTPDHIALLGKEEGGKGRRVEGKKKDVSCGQVLNATRGGQLTYRQLNEKANQLANVLKEKGVRGDVIVGIMVERSLEMIIGIFAVLKAEGAYMPIDPDYPGERIDFMLKDSGVKILVTVPGFSGEIEKLSVFNCQLFIINEKTFAGRRLNNPLQEASSSTLTSTSACQVSPANLAYVIYTSGSTGKPKGVLTTHYNVTRVVRETNYIELGTRDRILQLSHYAFDGSVFDIFGALLNGSALVLMPPREAASVDRLAEIIINETITVFFVTTALFNVLVDETPGIFPGLRKVLFGGERVSVEHSIRALEYAGKHKILHVYGPTETTVYATYYFVDEIPGQAATIPIGKPLNKTAVYILDRFFYPLPPGIVGELHIGGEGTARGYLNNPGLTNEKFLRGGARCFTGAVFSKSAPPGRRRQNIYRTGDMARWSGDGNIEFMGRRDKQVKIRGFRVELGEIESYLLKNEKIKEALVIFNEGPSVGKRVRGHLCAYLVCREGPDVQQLEKELSSQLPHYMIPGYFIPIEKIPLTANGKVDREALPAPGIKSGDQHTAPRDEIEKKLALIWSEVLGIEKERIGIDDNFFQQGGHSLKAAVFISRVHKVLNVKIPLVELFRIPQIRGLSAQVREARPESFVPIEAAEKKEYYSLSINQQRLWIIQQQDPGGFAYHMPGQILLHHAVDEKIVKKTFQEIIRCHESLRTAFKVIADKTVQVILTEVDAPFRRVDLSALQEEAKSREKGRLYREVAEVPFELAHAPLFRSLLLKLANERYELIYNIHHIISDGWSMAILENEFSRLYKGFRDGVQPVSPPLPIQYKDFCQWNEKQLQDPRARQESHRYWKEKLERGIPPLQLQQDFPANKNDKKGGGFRYMLDNQLKQQLEKTTRDNNTSLFIVMFSVYIRLLAHFSGQEEIACSFIASGREHFSQHQIIGFFAHSLVFVIQVDPEERFGHFLRRVHGEVMETLRHQSYPLEQLLDELKSKYPEISTSFNMINIGEESREKGPAPNEPLHITDDLQVKFQLEPYIKEYKNGIDMYWSYARAVYKPRTIEFMVTEYKEMLDFFSRYPDKSYNDYKLTKPGESIWE